MRKNFQFDYKRQYCYLKDVVESDIDSKKYRDNPYMIEDVITRQEINRYYEETETSNKIGKTLTAKLMSNSVENGTYQLSEECRQNFQVLFNRIFSYFEE